MESECAESLTIFDIIFYYHKKIDYCSLQYVGCGVLFPYVIGITPIGISNKHLFSLRQ